MTQSCNADVKSPKVGGNGHHANMYSSLEAELVVTPSNACMHGLEAPSGY